MAQKFQDNPNNLLETLSPRGQNLNQKYIHVLGSLCTVRRTESQGKIIFEAIVIWRFAFDLLLDIRVRDSSKKGAKIFLLIFRNVCNFYLPSLDIFFSKTKPSINLISYGTPGFFCGTLFKRVLWLILFTITAPQIVYKNIGGGHFNLVKR